MAKRHCSLKPWRSAASRICCWTVSKPPEKSEGMIAFTGVMLTLESSSDALRMHLNSRAKPQAALRRTEARQPFLAGGQDFEQFVELGDDENLVNLRLDVHQPQLAVLILQLLVHVDEHPQR